MTPAELKALDSRVDGPAVEAAKACLEQLEDLTSGGDHLLCVADLRAALGEQ